MGAKELKWVEEIENSVIDPPPTIRDGRALSIIIYYYNSEARKAYVTTKKRKSGKVVNVQPELAFCQTLCSNVQHVFFLFRSLIRL